MFQKFRNNRGRVAVIILSGGAVLCFIFSAEFLSAYPKNEWWIGIALLACGFLISYSSLTILKNLAKEKKIAGQKFNDLINDRNSNQATTSVLSVWCYSVSEWKDFIRWEKRERTRNTLIETFIIVMISTLFISFLRSADWKTALAMSLLVGLIYGSVKYYWTMSSIQWDGHNLPEVIITSDTVLVNGHLNRFYGNNVWLGHTQIKEVRDINILEITYCWKTKRGKTFDEIRVPIPKGKLREAIAVQEKLMAHGTRR